MPDTGVALVGAVRRDGGKPLDARHLVEPCGHKAQELDGQLGLVAVLADREAKPGLKIGVSAGIPQRRVKQFVFKRRGVEGLRFRFALFHAADALDVADVEGNVAIKK